MMEPVFNAVDLDAAARDIPATRRSTFSNRDAVIRRLLAGGDALAILIALAAATANNAVPGRGTQLLWGLFALPLFLVTFKLYGLYDRDVKRITHSTVDDLPWLFHASVVGGLLLWLYSRYGPMGRLTFLEILTFGVSVVVVVTCVRFVVRTTLADRVVTRDRALILGTGEIARTLATKIRSHPEYRVDVVGSLGLETADESMDRLAAPILGDFDDLEEVALRHGVTRVMLTTRDLDDSMLEELLQRCRAHSLKVSMLPRLADMIGPGLEIDDVEGVAVLGVNSPWLPRSSRAIKRAMDLLIASVLLFLFAPVIVIVALAIKLDSEGRVLFAQTRVGRNGRRFKLYKFRTMTSGAERQRSELLEKSADPNWLDLEHDPRITRVGRHLRRLSLDELPQLWNVIRGEMSLVGPRPLIPVEDERVRGWARGRLDLTPGLTGYWQVLGRTRIPFEEMVKLDYLYVMNWSLWEDVRLMLRTLPVVIGGRGAN
jgi:exopolysaccharide biosynthesis polyprenyl glycosylphosphotransferase